MCGEDGINAFSRKCVFENNVQLFQDKNQQNKNFSKNLSFKVFEKCVQKFDIRALSHRAVRGLYTPASY